MEWFGDMLGEPRLDRQLRMSWADKEGEWRRVDDTEDVELAVWSQCIPESST